MTGSMRGRRAIRRMAAVLATSGTLLLAGVGTGAARPSSSTSEEGS